jgi:hypothetical protein
MIYISVKLPSNTAIQESDPNVNIPCEVAEALASKAKSVSVSMPGGITKCKSLYIYVHAYIC